MFPLRSVKTLFLIFLFFFCALLSPVFCSDDFDFAEYLYDQGEYYRAISEWSRFLFFSPENKKASEAQYRIGLSYFRAGLYSQASEYFSAVPEKSPFRISALFMGADTMFKIGLYEPAREIYQKLEQESEADQADVLYRESWTYLMERKFSEVHDIYSKIREQFPDHVRTGGLVYLEESVRKMEDFKPLSPVLAAIMSGIIPGSGQFYAKRPGDGLVAFLAVVSLGASSYLLWKNYEHKEVAVLLSLTGVILYGGNIYTAYSSCYKYNRLYFDGNLSDLKENYWVGYDLD